LLLFEQSRGDVFSLFLSSWGYGEAWKIFSFLEYYVTTEEEIGDMIIMCFDKSATVDPSRQVL
jgi:hypothetical protein